LDCIFTILKFFIIILVCAPSTYKKRRLTVKEPQAVPPRGIPEAGMVIIKYDNATSVTSSKIF
jgi:hypothetical protein